MSGHLVAITTIPEEAYLGSLNSSGWIATTNAPLYGSFYYAAGPEAGLNVTVMPWQVGQTSGVGPTGANPCARIFQGLWYSDVCMKLWPYVVEYECATGYEFHDFACIGLFMHLLPVLQFFLISNQSFYG